MTALDRPFSFSQFSSYLRCPKLWEYRYKQGLTSLRPSAALRKGSLVDDGLTAALIGREEDTIMNCTQLATDAILTKYEEWADQDGISQMLATSTEFFEEQEQVKLDSISIATRVVAELELDTPKWETMRDSDGRLGVQYKVRHSLRAHKHGYIGSLDWVAKHEAAAWEIDFKVRKAFTDDDALGYDYQLSGYQYAAGDAFGRITGVAHYQAKSKPTTPPRIIKNGTLTKAKTQSCDWPTYRDTVHAHGFNLADYADMEHKLPEFQRWTWTRRSPTELNNTWEEIELLAERLVEAHHDTRPQPRALDPMKCSHCDMRQLCMAGLKGKDTDMIRLQNYKVREDYGPATSK